ncbi:anti-anti-sigma factor [Streptosporangium becharense]|uniref:Anti-anti-sigma factor n=1 Tax=Streptosporangium becharense TaxID=1816182 RepID=A0A7W9IGR9_9ACTN|nr:STAS domain-containing protein [Streptosporangium becharense]MBB2909207.1 anti-anti-sigma factor [Streptosporangium becharense]MBB5819774.1 anti-anti-sigma factor [Streptosporangium becharense]
MIRASGDLDYDYAPIFRQELTAIWGLDGDAPPPPPLHAPSQLPPVEAAFSVPAPFSSVIPSSPAGRPSPLSAESLPQSGPESPLTHLASEPPSSPLDPATSSSLFSPEVPLPAESLPPGVAVSPASPAVPLPAAGSPATSPGVLATSGTTSPGVQAPSGKAPLPGHAPRVILDLTELTFCDSTGLAELLWTLRRSQQAGMHLILVGPSRTLCHMLATTGLLPFFTLAASLEEALEGTGADPAEAR